MQEKDNHFLRVPYSFCRNKLTALEILILSKILEYNRNNLKCHISNEYLAILFNESVSSVERAIAKLEAYGYIKRDTMYVKGKHGRQREIIYLHNEATIDNNLSFNCNNNNIKEKTDIKDNEEEYIEYEVNGIKQKIKVPKIEIEEVVLTKKAKNMI